MSVVIEYDGKLIEFPDEATAQSFFESVARQQQPQQQVIAQTPDGSGRFVKDSAGRVSFVSPNYSTSDPEAVERLMNGEGVKRVVQSTTDRMTISQNPVAARGNEFVRGTPFVGSYLDEAVGAISPKAGQAMRQTSDAMQRENPGQSIGLNVAGGIAGAVPMALAGGLALMNMARNASPAVRAVGGGLLGMIGGGTEGTVYGYGEGQGDERLANAKQQGIIGTALGGILGSAMPLAGDMIQNLIARWKGEDVAAIANQFGVSRDAAKVLKTAFENNDQNAVANILRAGPDATLADAGRSGQALLDAAAQTGGRPLAIVEGAVNDRAARSLPALTQSLDDVLGAPQGPRAAARSVAQQSAPARTSAYNAAYNTPIDYATPEGREIESLFSRISPKKLQSAIDIVNERLRWDPSSPRQIMASIGDGGKVSFQEMPNVRQLDELKKALDQLGQDADAFGRPTGDALFAQEQARAVRNATINATGGEQGTYAQALKIGGDKIEMDRGLQLGLDMLRDTNQTTREMVNEQLSGMSSDARKMVKIGLRSYIDETLGKVKMIASNPDAMESRQAMQALRLLTTDNAKSKLKALLGPDEYRKLMPALDRAIASQNMVASVATNSKTAVRQAVQGQVDDITSPGILGRAARGQPLNAAESLVQELLSTTPGDDAARKQQIWTEVATVLSQRQGNKSAEAALRSVQKALQGNNISEAEARLIANQVMLGGGIAGYESGQGLLQLTQ